MDDNDLIFSSKWEIDQLDDDYPKTKTVSAGDTSIETIPDVNYPPYIEVQFKPSGSTKWFQAGTNGTGTAASTLFTWYWYISGSDLFVSVPVGGDVRYFFWVDRINY